MEASGKSLELRTRDVLLIVLLVALLAGAFTLQAADRLTVAAPSTEPVPVATIPARP